MTAAREPLFECQECGHKFYTEKAAERAAFGDRGCPGCGGSDIDIYVGRKGKSIGRFGGIWRKLSPEETKEFRKWARNNYVVSTPINKVWHPVVQEECHKMNRECSCGKYIGKFGGQIFRIPKHNPNPGKGAGIRSAKLNDKKAEWMKKERD